MLEAQARRISRLGGHLRPPPPALQSSLAGQVCAAHQVVSFARPARQDVQFALPAAQVPPPAECRAAEVAGSALASLQALLGGTPVGGAVNVREGPAGLPSPCWSLEDEAAGSPPRYARPALGQEGPPASSRTAAAGMPYTQSLQQQQGGEEQRAGSSCEAVPSQAAGTTGSRGSGRGGALLPLAGRQGARQLLPGLLSITESDLLGSQQLLPGLMLVAETELGWVAQLPLPPGLGAEELRVELAGVPPAVVVSGGRAADGARTVFEARWALPEGANPDGARAEVKDDVLLIRVARRSAA